MAAKVASVLVTADTDLNSPFKQSITTSDLGGSTPDAVLVEVGYSTNNTGTLQAVETGCLGMSDGTTSVVTGFRSQDVGAGSTNTDSYASTSYLGVIVHPTTNTLAHYFTLDAFTADGCDITWDAQPSRTVYMKFTFFVAARAEVKTFSMPTGDTVDTSTISVSWTDSSLNPSFGYLATCRATYTTGNNFSTEQAIGTGMFVSDRAGTPTIKQSAKGWARQDGVSSAWQGSVFHNSEDTTARCLATATVPVANGSGSNELEVTNSQAGALTLTRRNAVETTAYSVMILAVDFDGEIDTDLGFVETGTATTPAVGSTIAVTGLGWRPQYYLWDGYNEGSSDYNRGNFSAGINLTGDANGVIGIHSENRDNNDTDTFSYADTGVCYLYNDADPQVLVIDLSHSSYDSGGFTLDVNTYTRGTALHTWVAFESVVEIDPDELGESFTLSTANFDFFVEIDPDELGESFTLSVADEDLTVGIDPDELGESFTLSTANFDFFVGIDPDELSESFTFSTANEDLTVVIDPDELAESFTFSTANFDFFVGIDPDELGESFTLSTANFDFFVGIDPDQLDESFTFSTASSSDTVVIDPDELGESFTLSTANFDFFVGIDPDELGESFTLSTANPSDTVLIDPDELGETFTLSVADEDLTVIIDPDQLDESFTLSTANSSDIVEIDPQTLLESFTLSTISGVREVRAQVSGISGSGQLLPEDLLAGISLSISLSNSGSFSSILARFRGLAMGLRGSGQLDGDLLGADVAPVTQYERIQRTLLNTAKAGQFHVLQYNSSTDEVSVLDTTDQPASIIAQEISSKFSIPRRYRLKHRLERSEWPWEVKLDFNRPVAVELFEEQLASGPIYLKRDEANNLQQVTLEIQSVRYEHPLQHQPERGSRIVINMMARLGPV